jgi:hypothetical protein
MFQEVMIHQSFQPNCVSKSFTFLMISKLLSYSNWDKPYNFGSFFEGYKIDC